MTAKRFEMGYDDGLLRFVKDNVTNTNLDIVDCWTVLNELNDENEQLRQQVQRIHKLINSKIQSARELGSAKTVIALKNLQRELNGDDGYDYDSY